MEIIQAENKRIIIKFVHVYRKKVVFAHAPGDLPNLKEQLWFIHKNNNMSGEIFCYKYFGINNIYARQISIEKDLYQIKQYFSYFDSKDVKGHHT